MKHLTVAAAALFLLAGAGMSLADDAKNAGGGQAGTTAGGAATTTNSTGGGNDATGSTSSADKSGSCSHQTPGDFNTFNEECRRRIEIWVQKQNSATAQYEGDLTVGTELPGSVEFTEVPDYPNYGYAMVNGKRVLIDRDTHKIVHVY